jgi:NAD(P)-dependent dehydrogenase (short-subunit alcohol dehydrogenase family)
MDLQLQGKHALVTGSTAGIGLAAAAGLYREGASVVVNGRTQSRVDEAVARLKAQNDGSTGGQVTGLVANLSTAEGVATFVADGGVVRAIV